MMGVHVGFQYIKRPPYNPTTHEFCTKCRQVKPHKAFPKGSKEGCKNRSGLHYWCLECNEANRVVWMHKAPENLRIGRDIAALSSRRRTVRDGKRPPGYWNDKPILWHRPAEYERRLQQLGIDEELDYRRL